MDLNVCLRNPWFVLAEPWLKIFDPRTLQMQVVV